MTHRIAGEYGWDAEELPGLMTGSH